MSKVYDYETCWIVRCPATGSIHIPKDGRWTFNGDVEKPTFHPSVIERCGKEGQTLEELKADPNPRMVNHVFIRDGYIEYLPDCTHSLASTTVEIPDYYKKVS